MAESLLITFSNAYSWMKINVFQFELHWTVFLKVQISLFQEMTWCLQATSHYLHQCWVGSPNIIRPQAPVPLMVIRSNLKFGQNLDYSDLNVLSRTQQNFAHVTTVSLSSHVQNFVVIGQIYEEQEHCKFSFNFDFDQNIVSGTGARLISIHPNM